MDLCQKPLHSLRITFIDRGMDEAMVEIQIGRSGEGEVCHAL